VPACFTGKFQSADVALNQSEAAAVLYASPADQAEEQFAAGTAFEDIVLEHGSTNVAPYVLSG
jgi:hypothetical protein